MNAGLLASCMIAHFVADFVFQPRDMAINKSKDLYVLGLHASINYLVFVIATVSFLGFDKAIVFAGLNAFIHGLIDWYIWRGFKAFKGKTVNIATYQYWEKYEFWTVVGFDQLLHGLTIIFALVIVAGV